MDIEILAILTSITLFVINIINKLKIKKFACIKCTDTPPGTPKLENE